MTKAVVPRGERLRDRPDFVRFWSAATVSAFGTYVTTLAIQVIVVQRLHGGATEVGVVNAARWLPYVVFGVVAGVLVERLRRRPLLVSTDLVRAGLLLAVPVLAMLDALSVGVLAMFMAVFGALTLAFDTASQSFVPRLVPRRLLPRAHSRLDASDAVSQAGGPAIGGGLVALLTAPWAVIVDAVSYLVSGLVLLRTRVDEPASRGLSVRGVRGEALEGLRWVYRHRTLLPYALGTHTWFLFWAAASAVLPVFALNALHVGAGGLGLFLAAAGVGAVLGSVVAPALGARFGPGRVVVAGYLGAALGWTATALATSAAAGLVAFALGQLVIGVALGMQNSHELGYRQAVTPDHLQARMGANLRSINRGMIVVGAPLGGLLADTVGLRPVLLAAACGFALLALAMRPTAYWRASYDD